MRQAYLFAGPRGTGKTSMARILAKALNCTGIEGPTAHPDKTCHVCVAIANGTSLDVVEMDAGSQCGIDDIREIREIREGVVLQPVEGRHEVPVLDEARQLTNAAAARSPSPASSPTRRPRSSRAARSRSKPCAPRAS